MLMFSLKLTHKCEMNESAFQGQHYWCGLKSFRVMLPKNEDNQDTWTISIYSLFDYSSDYNLTQKNISGYTGLSVTLSRSFVMTWKTDGRTNPPVSECRGECCVSLVQAVQYMLHIGKCLSLKLKSTQREDAWIEMNERWMKCTDTHIFSTWAVILQFSWSNPTAFSKWRKKFSLCICERSTVSTFMYPFSYLPLASTGHL